MLRKAMITLQLKFFRCLILQWVWHLGQVTITFGDVKKRKNREMQSS